jgi:hypothetical protein
VERAAYSIPRSKLHNPRKELTHAAEEDEHPDHGIGRLDAARVQAVDGYEEDVFFTPSVSHLPIHIRKHWRKPHTRSKRN